MSIRRFEGRFSQGDVSSWFDINFRFNSLRTALAKKKYQADERKTRQNPLHRLEHRVATTEEKENEDKYAEKMKTIIRQSLLNKIVGNVEQYRSEDIGNFNQTIATKYTKRRLAIFKLEKQRFKLEQQRVEAKRKNDKVEVTRLAHEIEKLNKTLNPFGKAKDVLPRHVTDLLAVLYNGKKCGRV